MSNALVIPSPFPPSSKLLLVILLAASASPLSAGPAARIAVREDAELAEAKATRRASASRAAREVSIPASVTWTRTEPASTPLDAAGSVLWRNKGAIGLGVGGYMVASDPGRAMDGLAQMIHGPVVASQLGNYPVDPSAKSTAGQFGTVTVIGWLVQTVGPFALTFTAGALVLPMLRYLFRPRNR